MKTYSIEELEAMRRVIYNQLVFREGWNPHNPYELERVVEERLRTHMHNGDNERVLREYFEQTAKDPPPPPPPVNADREQVERLRGWLGRISTCAGFNAHELKDMARWALAGFPEDFVIPPAPPAKDP